jgi:hypothetical protein
MNPAAIAGRFFLLERANLQALTSIGQKGVTLAA